MTDYMHIKETVSFRLSIYDKEVITKEAKKRNLKPSTLMRIIINGWVKEHDSKNIKS